MRWLARLCGPRPSARQKPIISAIGITAISQAYFSPSVATIPAGTSLVRVMMKAITSPTIAPVSPSELAEAR